MSDNPLAVRIGMRTSRLALWQTERIIHLLTLKFPTLRCTVVPFSTEGDRNLATPLPALGGKGVFTSELEDRLRSGEIDLAVHSLKDLPVEPPAGIEIGAICDREDVRDVLVANGAWTFATLPKGAVVGTCSLRRQAQLLALRPDLTIEQIRGNVPSRIEKVRRGDYDATILAAAGLLRLGLQGAATSWFTLEEMLPAPGQGALAVQCRADDGGLCALLATIDSPQDRAATTAERRFLEALGGGCSAPVAAYAQVDCAGRLSMQGVVSLVDGTHSIRVQGRMDSLGKALCLADELARMAFERGAQAIIDAA